MNSINMNLLLELRKKYPKGTRVELMQMDDPYTRLTEGDRGTVDFIDDLGTIHVNWDCGSTLGILYGVDSCRIILEEKSNG